MKPKFYKTMNAKTVNLAVIILLLLVGSVGYNNDRTPH